MPKNISKKPRNIPQVMVSSTFTDLREHREALIHAIHAHKVHANVMENDSARLGDVIDSSLQMVRDSAAYIGVIGLKYGQIPESPARNPDKLSITELEFNEAQRLGRPILLFIMGDDHPVKKAEVEKGPEKERKLNAFRERAKKALPGSAVNRVYAVFNSLDEFKGKVSSSLAELRTHLDSNESDTSGDESKEARDNAVPKPPAFYAEPDYIGSHKFVGRVAELQVLSDWAAPADPTNLLIFEAIGGNGKSMLTWEWTKNHALAARPFISPWAGRFWYSFYERGANMSDFCQHALAYMTSRPLEEFAKKKTAELTDELLAQLHARPWLIILDGLERVLVAYHRIDAAEAPDEEANAPTDTVLNRNPHDAIREDDNDMLRALAAAAPSKILVSSRLTPRVLLNPSGQPITGAKRITLPGLRPPDAEKLLRSCGVREDSSGGITGDSAAIQSYLTANCDNHPLVIGILGGLIANYLPDRGNFGAWVADPQAGAALDLASLDLIQRRNHILSAALDALPTASQTLLSTLALLTDSVDYETLKALNPHLPPEPEEVRIPTPLAKQWDYVDGKIVNWPQLSEERKAKLQKQYEAALIRWQEYDKVSKIRGASAQSRDARWKLDATIADLEQRGLLHWDGHERKYKLHPVVRGLTSGRMTAVDRERYGQRVVDYFSAQPLTRETRPATLYIHHLIIENIRCFERLELNFCRTNQARPMTLFLGDNAVGKTTILRCLALVLCNEISAASLIDGLDGDLLRYGCNEGRITVVCGERDTGDKTWKLEARIIRGPGDAIAVKQHNSWDLPVKRLFACAYGALRGGFGTKSYERYEVHDSVRSLFDYTSSLQNPELVIRRLEAGGHDIAGVCDQMNHLLMLGDNATKIDANGISVEGSWRGRVPVGAIGDGYAATLAWLVDFWGWALFHDNRFLNSPISGIVILDEIEKHLHPRWQRHIIRQLCEQFPLVQFILTSHSPICAGGVADLNEGQGAIFVLSHEHEAPQQIEPPAGWRYDQILTSSAFGLTSARDATTEEIQTRLRKAYERDRERAGKTDEFKKALAELESRSITAAEDEMDRQNRLRLATELEDVKKLLESIQT